METKRGMCQAGCRGTPEAVPEATGSLKWAGCGRGAGAGAGWCGPGLPLQMGLREPQCPSSEFGVYPECQSVTGTRMSGRERKLGFRALGGDGVNSRVTPGRRTGVQGDRRPFIRRWTCGRRSGGAGGHRRPVSPRDRNGPLLPSPARSQGPGGPPGHPQLRALLLRLPRLRQPLRADGSRLHAPGGESEQRRALALVQPQQGQQSPRR